MTERGLCAADARCRLAGPGDPENIGGLAASVGTRRKTALRGLVNELLFQLAEDGGVAEADAGIAPDALEEGLEPVPVQARALDGEAAEEGLGRRRAQLGTHPVELRPHRLQIYPMSSQVYPMSSQVWSGRGA